MVTQPDPPTEELIRQLYWQRGETPRAALGTHELRERLLEFTAQMRTDQNQQIPYGEETITSRGGWRRWVKYRLFRMLRPMSKRYDRLLGDLADLSVGLAERLAAAEAEIDRLREHGGDDGGNPGS
jgi:hypothetical protein